VFCPDVIIAQRSLAAVEDIQLSFQINAPLQTCELNKQNESCQENAAMHIPRKILSSAKRNKLFQLSNLLVNKFFNKRERINNTKYNVHERNVNENNPCETSCDFKQNISKTIPEVNLNMLYESNYNVKKHEKTFIPNDSMESNYSNNLKDPLGKRFKRFASNDTWNKNFKSSNKGKYAVTQLNQGWFSEKIIRQITENNISYLKKFSNNIKRMSKDLFEHKKNKLGEEDNVLRNDENIGAAMVRKIVQKNNKIDNRLPTFNPVARRLNLIRINEYKSYMNEKGGT
jgi:hypothetical protein